MSFYTEMSGISKFYPEMVAINTIVTDFMGDQMIFYRDGNRFSDGGYYYFETEMAYPRKANRICEAIAKNNFCKFEDEEFVCESENHDLAVARLIQCGTAVGTYIMFNRG